MRSLPILAALAFVPFQLSSAQKPAVKWGPAPAIFPAGARMAVMQGDPSKSQLFTIRLDLPFAPMSGVVAEILDALRRLDEEPTSPRA